MGIFGDYFNPQSYAPSGNSGGILDALRGLLAPQTGPESLDQFMLNRQSPMAAQASAQPQSGPLNLLQGLFGQQGNAQPQPQQQMRQPQPQQMPQPQPQSPGIGDRLMAGFGGFANSTAPLPSLFNLIQGLATGQRSDPGAVQLQQKQAMYGALIQLGVPPQQAQLAIMHPKFMEAMVARLNPTFEQFKQEQVYGNFNKNTGATNIQGAVPKFETLSSDQILHSVTPGVPGGVPSPGGPVMPGMLAGMGPPQRAPSSIQVATGGPRKAPDGYQWNDPSGDPNKGMSPIAGGPATQLPAEAAGRLALIEAAKPGVIEARRYFLDPKNALATKNPAGLPGQMIGQHTQSFEIGRQQRNIRLATEAALRLATGAAAPDSEVKRYADFYTPSIYDTLPTRKQKLDALNRFLSYSESNIQRGRVPDPQVFMQGGVGNTSPHNTDPLGLR